MIRRSVLWTILAGAMVLTACDRPQEAEPAKVEPSKTASVPSSAPNGPQITVTPSRGSDAPRPAADRTDDAPTPGEGPTPGEAPPPAEVGEAPAAIAPTTPAPTTPDATAAGSKSTPDAAAAPGPAGRPAKAFSECNPSQTFASGRCFASFDAACAALACSTSCTQLRSRPPQARCAAAKKPAKDEGRAVAAFTDCRKSETFAKGRCYATYDAACRALSCSGSCTKLRSMPVQAACSGS